MVPLKLHGFIWKNEVGHVCLTLHKTPNASKVSTQNQMPQIWKVRKWVTDLNSLTQERTSEQDVGIKTNDKCHPLKPKSFLMGKDTSFKQNDSLKNERKSLQIRHLIVSV